MRSQNDFIYHRYKRFRRGQPFTERLNLPSYQQREAIPSIQEVRAVSSLFFRAEAENLSRKRFGWGHLKSP
jgi:hypothetical protein